MNWDVSLSTGIALGRPLADVLAPAKSAGFSRIQIAAFPGHFDYHDPGLVDGVKREMDRLGLTATSAHAPYGNAVDITQLREPDRAHAVAEVNAAATALARLGGKVLVVHAGSTDEMAAARSVQHLEMGLVSLKEIHRHCRALGIGLAIEDMLAHLVGGRTEEMQWVLEHMRLPGVGVCLDTGHSFLARDLLGRARRFGPRIVMVHAHDNAGVFDDHLPPGEGDIPWGALLETLADVGFQGELVLEVNERAEADLLDRARRAALFLQECARGKPFQVRL